MKPSVTSPVPPATTGPPKQYWLLTQRKGQSGAPKAAAANTWFPEERCRRKLFRWLWEPCSLLQMATVLRTSQPGLPRDSMGRNSHGLAPGGQRPGLPSPFCFLICCVTLGKYPSTTGPQLPYLIQPPPKERCRPILGTTVLLVSGVLWSSWAVPSGETGWISRHCELSRAAWRVPGATGLTTW